MDEKVSESPTKVSESPTKEAGSRPNGVRQPPSVVGIPRLKRHFPPVMEALVVGAPVVRPAYLVDEEFRQPPTTTIQRIQQPEVEGIALWLVPKLQPKLPRLTAQNFVVWMKAMLINPDWLFIRSKNTVGVASFTRTFYEPEGEVYEVGVVAQEPSASDTLAVYRAFEDWARQKKARKSNIGSNLGADITPFAEVLGYTHYIQAFWKELEY